MASSESCIAVKLLVRENTLRDRVAAVAQEGKKGCVGKLLDCKVEDGSNDKQVM